MNGQPGPGQDFLSALQRALGDLPIIAEDLGLITPDAIELRDSFDLPGMKILQFGFGSPTDAFLPATTVPAQLRGLHRHARQRHGAGLINKGERELARRY